MGENTNASTEHIASHGLITHCGEAGVCGLQPGRRNCKPCLCPVTPVKGGTNCCAYTCNCSGQILETTTEDLTRTQTSEGNSGVLVKDFRLFCREYHRAHAS